VQPTWDTPPIIPKLNIYLRPANQSHVQQITDIYNWYIQNSVHVADLKQYTVEQIRQKIEEISKASLQVIVAIERSTVKEKNTGNGRGSDNGIPVSEKVLGFAWADDYHSMFDSAHRYTADIELYVHCDYLLNGIGNCLLDRLLYFLDPGYQYRGGYEWTEDSVTFRGERVIKTILCHALYASEELDRIVFLDRWLRQYGLRKVGELEDIGIKQRKR